MGEGWIYFLDEKKIKDVYRKMSEIIFDQIFRGIGYVQLYNRLERGRRCALEDRQLIELIKSDQDKGIAQLQKVYSGLIHYIVSGILKDRLEIEECVSDIYVKVWKSIDSYSQEKGRFNTWISVISRNTALNYTKRRNWENIELRDEIADTASVEKEVLRREDAEKLKDVIRTLTSEEQQIFYRKYYYLQMTATIAKEMGLTERSVEGKLYRMRKKLQTRMGGDFR